MHSFTWKQSTVICTHKGPLLRVNKTFPIPYLDDYPCEFWWNEPSREKVGHERGDWGLLDTLPPLPPLPASSLPTLGHLSHMETRGEQLGLFIISIC